MKFWVIDSGRVQFYREEVIGVTKLCLIDDATMALDRDWLFHGRGGARYYPSFGYPAMKSCMERINQALKWKFLDGPMNPNHFGGCLEELVQNYVWRANKMTTPWVYIFHTQIFTAWHTEPGFMGSCLPSMVYSSTTLLDSFIRGALVKAAATVSQ